jgi:hypothetical protein
MKIGSVAVLFIFIFAILFGITGDFNATNTAKTPTNTAKTPTNTAKTPTNTPDKQAFEPKLKSILRTQPSDAPKKSVSFNDIRECSLDGKRRKEKTFNKKTNGKI